MQPLARSPLVWRLFVESIVMEESIVRAHDLAAVQYAGNKIFPVAEAAYQHCSKMQKDQCGRPFGQESMDAGQKRMSGQ